MHFSDKTIWKICLIHERVLWYKIEFSRRICEYKFKISFIRSRVYWWIIHFHISFIINLLNSALMIIYYNIMLFGQVAVSFCILESVAKISASWQSWDNFGQCCSATKHMRIPAVLGKEWLRGRTEPRLERILRSNGALWWNPSYLKGFEV